MKNLSNVFYLKVVEVGIKPKHYMILLDCLSSIHEYTTHPLSCLADSIGVRKMWNIVRKMFEYCAKKIEEWMSFNGKYSLEKKNDSRGDRKQISFFLSSTQLTMDAFFLVDRCLMFPYVYRLCGSAISHLLLEPL